jgi:hypothetical protein
MSDDTAVRDLARLIVRELVEDPQFTSMIREMVLLVYATTDKLSREGYVRSLLRACKERGADVKINKVGAVIISNGKRLTPDLLDAMKIYRQDIIDTLKPQRNGRNRVNP